MDRLRNSVRSSRVDYKTDGSLQELYLNSGKGKNETPDKEIGEDVEAVAKLEYWSYTKNHDCLVRTNTARESLERKLKSEDIVEAHLHRRKLGSMISEATLTSKQKSKYYKSYEEECLNSYHDIQNKLILKIETRDLLRKVQIDLKSELDKDERKLKDLEKRKLLAPLKINIPKSGVENTKILVELIKRRSTVLDKTQLACAELIQNIEMLQIDIKNKSKELAQVESEIESLRKGQKLVKQDIIKHFLQILKQGTDTRGEGLYTTVKFLLGFKIELKSENFPTGLDEASINSIQQIAEKHLELDNLYEKLSKCYLNKVNVTHSSMTIKDRLASLKKTIKVRKPDYSAKAGRIWHGVELLNSTTDTFETGVSETLRIEDRIRSIKQEIQDLKDSEVRRLTKDCLKSGKDIKILASYIVGTDNLIKYKLVMMKEFQNLEKVKQKTRTFSFTSYLVPQAKLNINKN